MTERTALGEKILNHWREHCPQMVRDLEKENRLEQAVFEAQTRTGDLLYELVSVKKMEYQAAWELAMEEWALAEQKASGTRPSQQPTSPKSSRKPRRRRRATSG
jgi:hypothetical protein